MYDVLDVIKNIQDLYENNTSLAILKDVERVFDELDLYIYKNWEDGELAYGPKVSRYWITIGFMWPKNKMPDPDGGKRLLDVGCKIKYEKTYLIEPISIKTPDDFRPGTKKGKLQRNPIWVIEITMPKQLAFDIYKGYMNKMRNDMEQIDEEPVNSATTASPAIPGAMSPPAQTTTAPPGIAANAAPTTPSV